MQLSGAKLSGSNVGNYSVSYSALLGFTKGQYTVNNSGYSYPLSMYPGFSFSRSSSAYSLDGSKQYPSNTPRISSGGLLVEAASTNLITNSAMTSGTGWSFYNASAGSNVTAPDGTTTALQVHYTASNGAIYQSGIALTAGTVYTLSCWVQWVSGSTQFYLVANPGASTIVTATGTWTRYTSTFTATANANIGVNGDPSVAGQVLNVWGYQVEAASSASSYIPTTTAAVTRTADAATQTYTGTATSVTVTTPGLGAMTYPVAGVTNIAVGSSDLSNTTNWPDFTAGNNNRATGFTAPDGSATAVKLMPTSANSPGHHLVQQSVTASGTTTFSFFAKAAEYNYLVLSGYSYNYVSFNLTTGAITDGSSGLSGFAAVYVGNGGWRCSATGSGNWGGQIQFGAAPDNSNAAFTGNGTSGIYVWGPQFEVGAAANGYVPTTTGAATFTPSSPFTLSAAPFLGQNIQSLLITGSSGTIVSLDFINNVYSTKSNYSYTTATSTPGFSFTNSTGGYSLDGSTYFGVNYQPYSTNMAGIGTWYPFGGSSASISSTPAPDGSLTATNINLSGGAEWYCGYQTNPIPSGAVVTMSCWLRSATGTAPVQFDYTGSGDDYNPSIFTVDTTWRRYTWTHTTTFASGVFAFAAGGSASNFLAWGPQIELGSTATAYAPVAGTTYTSAPRITSAGLLVEPSSTNWFWPSQTPPLVTATDRAGGATVAAASITAPDGTSTAQTITSDTSYGFHGMGLTVSTAGVTTITGSFYFKSNTNPFLKFRLNANDGNSCQAYFDTSGANATTFYNTGTITNNSFQLISLPNGWYRAILTCTLPNATTGPTLVVGFCNGFGNDYYTGSASDQIAVWGFQYELGTTTATSLIPTTTAAVTRAADVVSLTFSGTATSIVVTYTGGTASPATSSPLNLGASSGGAWVGQNIQSVAIS